MKVVVVCGFAPSLVIFRGPLLREMVRRGHDVVALAPPDGLDAAAVAALGIRFEAIPLERAGLNPLGDLVTLLALRRRIARHRPDVVFAYTIKAVIYAGLAARHLPARRFAMITGLGYAFLDSSTLRRRVLAGVALRGAGRVAVPGDRIDGVAAAEPEARQRDQRKARGAPAGAGDPAVRSVYHHGAIA